MFPVIHIAGHVISMYKLMFFAGLASVPVFCFCLRKTFGFGKGKTAFISGFTLAFGYLSAMITAWLENWLLGLASGGANTHLETIRNYGIPMFLPLFFLVYCIFFREPFRRITDFIAPCVYSVMTFIKIGCTLWGCCYGEPDEHGIMNLDLGYRTFPVQVYDAISSFVIVVICLVLIFTLRKKHEGRIYPIGGMLFALTKGFWESFRVHSSVWERNFLNTGFTFWQYWMLLLFIGCAVWLALTVREEKKGIQDFDKR